MSSEAEDRLRCQCGPGSRRVRKHIPKSMLLIENKLLWCPNAKAGTTSMWANIWKFSGTESEDRRCYRKCPHKDPFLGHVQSAWEALEDSNSEVLCKARSFTIARNPFDRLISGYKGKVQTGKIALDGKIQRRRKHDARSVPDFAEFIRHLDQHPDNVNANEHWRPLDTKCLQGFEYDEILQL